ncbi:hypothetical protein HHI36_005710 [Cryptolaemus montrouzieri]|uniref:Uncharacterized protein n=1 Tax=Cryptolaemus montrouzieri TaxID=559131 RepID=A0ABD2NWH8_9CUCU
MWLGSNILHLAEKVWINLKNRKLNQKQLSEPAENISNIKREVREGNDDTKYQVWPEDEYSDDIDSLSENNDNSSDIDANNVPSSLHWDDLPGNNQSNFI